MVIVRKKDSRPHYCIDFHRLNITKNGKYPVPFIHTILDKLQSAKHFSTLDLKTGYWEVALPEESNVNSPPGVFGILGHVITEVGLKTDPEKMVAITKMPAPRNIKRIRQFLGAASWHCCFIPKFPVPLTWLTKRVRVKC